MDWEVGRLFREASIEDAILELGLGKWWPFPGRYGEGRVISGRGTQGSEA